MEKDNKPLYGIRYTIKPKDIPGFVSELRLIQENMIEAVVQSKESQGFPEASAVIRHIMEKK